ncbi:glycosyltransferase family 4 protein [Pseudomonas sp. RIT-PI-S]|uniref:MraY family glycosyltransferase n=1 Tax=Pseudomonas sp. RIT-PI-S TaxID=3035295 RepID=UPI0021DA66BE|nr:glycosyltransferase family 4 protein [Pseudomonas sp. RIT-PI-S]
MTVSLVLVSLVSSLVMTAGLRRYALAKRVLDVPNARSSHTVPTPRGGGVAIVLVFLIGLALLWKAGSVPTAVMLALAGAGSLVAFVGFLDDHSHIPARWRLLGHFVASAWALFWLQGLPSVQLLHWRLEGSWLLAIIGCLYLVWLLNLYNFMDGIDGIASVQAICVCGGNCLIYWASGHGELIAEPALLAAAAAGFLYWNFPPARIFMGDAGSGFLGIALGVLSVQAAWASPALFWGWLILLGVFIVDATFTLARRLARGDKVYEAHRSHAYQFASRRYGKHLPVTIGVGIINVFWLLPIALCVALLHLDGLIGLCIAYVPLVGLALRFKAGAIE